MICRNTRSRQAGSADWKNKGTLRVAPKSSKLPTGRIRSKRRVLRQTTIQIETTEDEDTPNLACWLDILELRYKITADLNLIDANFR